ncbi:hypothetical protein SE18_09825 [Herpetosiphon geysericola]|uniref:Uncharacterized protein n=1 Tax=Herpetosiphon geysericola TaxID=70996 RepID=A0A0P6XZE8_9CHLR|nr:hypothetical protein SE18_09825 [Herpetosiphon geysericola]
MVVSLWCILIDETKRQGLAELIGVDWQLILSRLLYDTLIFYGNVSIILLKNSRFGQHSQPSKNECFENWQRKRSF